jgi:hypothetical protein
MKTLDRVTSQMTRWTATVSGKADWLWKRAYSMMRMEVIVIQVMGLQIIDGRRVRMGSRVSGDDVLVVVNMEWHNFTRHRFAHLDMIGGSSYWK